MKKAFPIAALFLSAGFALSAGGAQTVSQDSDLTARVATLEDALAQEQRAHAETRALVDQTVEYLQQQADSAKSMMSALDQSEAAGFTAGINFQSREILLAAWRDVWSSAQEDVPSSEKKKAAVDR